MSAQLIYAHQGCTWAMFPTSWHRCWHDNPTCLCAFPQRPALSQHMASVDCRVMHGCQAWDSWSTAVVFLILYSAGGVWSLGTACMFSRARTFSHTHMFMPHGAYVYIHTCLCMCICSNQVFVSCAFFFSVDGCRLAAKSWGCRLLL